MICAFLPLLLVICGFHRLAFGLDHFLFPKAFEVRPRKPLFVVGVPRSGTTLFHRLVASQKDTFTTFPLWELIFAPALCEKYLVGFLYRLDQICRFGKTQKGPFERFVDGVLWLVARLTNDVHPTDFKAPEEDSLGLIPFDGCFLRVLIWPERPSTWDLGYFARLSKTRQMKLVLNYRQLVQRHLYYRGTDLFLVSKNPGFVTWVESLKQEFPDACFVGLRRSPLESVPSQLSSIQAGMAAFGFSSRESFVVDQFVDLLAHYWHELDRLQESLGRNEYRLVDYEALVPPSEDMVTSLLKEFAYEIKESDLQRLAKVIQASAKYRSKHRYALEDYGLGEQILENKFFSRKIDAATVSCMETTEDVADLISSENP